jgi:WD40 repeat protein/DNA-binding SARP family transcriptional activator
MRQLRLHLFGPFQASIDGMPVHQFEAATARGLLAYLAINAERPHSRESLAALLWNPDAGSSGLTNFRSALRRVRVALDDQGQYGQEPFLLVQRDTVQWNVRASTWVDVCDFDDLLAQIGRHPHGQVENCPSCVARLTQAAALYRGPFLANLFIDHLGFEEWQRAEQERYHRLVLQTLNILASHHYARRAYGQAEEYARRQLALEAWNEEAHRQLMAALAASGQRSAALAQYEVCRRILASELAAEPDGETIALYESIRAAGHRAIAVAKENPYKSLQPFAARDAGRFLGRERYTEALLSAVQCQPFVAVIGPSGSGKTSLIHAGLLARLADLTPSSPNPAWFPAVATPGHPTPLPRYVLQLRPGSDPFLSLAEAARPLLDPTWDATELAEMLRSNRYSLADLGRAITDGAIGDGAIGDGAIGDGAITGGRRTATGPHRARLLLVIDPFEEIFTLCSDPAVRGAFLDFLFATSSATLFDTAALGAEPGDPPVVCVASLRADFMAQALVHRSLAEALQDSSIILGPMSRDELQRAIVEPARAEGVSLEPGLLERLLQDVGAEPGHLPLLQFALTLLWERQTDSRLTHAAYAEIGGVGGALASYCERTFSQLVPDDQARARHIFLHMVQVGDPSIGGLEVADLAANTPRSVTRTDLHPDDWPLVQRLASARLLVTDRNAAGVETVAVAHEALIHNWSRLRGWIEDDREFRSWQEWLRRRLRQWQGSGRDAGGLLRGSDLGEAKNWRERRHEELTPAMRRYIEASLEQRELEQAVADSQRQRERAHLLALRAQLALVENNTGLALALAVAGNAIPDPPPEAQLVLATAAYAPGTRLRMEGHCGPVSGVVYCAGGRTAISSGADGMLRRWDLTTGALSQTWQAHVANINGLTSSPDGRLLSASADGSISLWDGATGCQVGRLAGHDAGVCCITVSADGRRAASGSADGTIIVWDLRAGRERLRLNGHGGAVTCAAFSPDGTRLLSGAENRSMVLWDTVTGRVLWECCGRDTVLQDSRLGHASGVTGVAFLPDGRRGLSISEDQGVYLWDLEDHALLHHKTLPFVGLLSLDLSPDGRTALLGTLDSHVILLNLADWTVRRQLVGHAGRVLAAALNPDGRTALSASADGDVRLWDLLDGAEVRRLEFSRSDTGGASIDLSPDGRWALTGFGNGDILLWDYATGEEIRCLQGHREMIFAGAHFRRDGRTAVSASGDIWARTTDNTVRLWDLETGAELHQFAGHTRKIWELALSEDGRYAVTGSQDGTVRWWDLEARTGRVLRDFSPLAIVSTAISPDGLYVLVGPGMGSSARPNYALRLIDAGNGRELRRFTGHNEAVAALAFSPDGYYALSGGNDKLLVLWDVATANIVHLLEGHTSSIAAVAFSPDGRLALSASNDRSVILWDLRTGSAIRRYAGHDAAVVGAVFTADGKRLVSVSVDGWVREWRADATLAELREWVAVNRYVPQLTPQQRWRYGLE